MTGLEPERGSAGKAGCLRHTARREPERAEGERRVRREAPGESRHPLQRYLAARRAGRYLCFVTGLEPTQITTYTPLKHEWCILVRPTEKELMMATSSIFDSVKISDKQSAERLVDAIESSRKAAPAKVTVNHRVVELDDKAIRDTFGRK